MGLMKLVSFAGAARSPGSWILDPDSFSRFPPQPIWVVFAENYANRPATGFLWERQVLALSIGYSALSAPSRFGSTDSGGTNGGAGNKRRVRFSRSGSAVASAIG